MAGSTPLYDMRTNKAELHLGKDRLKMCLPSIHKNTTSCHVEEESASVSQGLEHGTVAGRPWLPRAVYSDSAVLLCLFLSTQQQAQFDNLIPWKSQ